jgi:hypothetical protein
VGEAKDTASTANGKGMIKFTAKFWGRLGDQVRDLFFEHVVQKGLDYQGREFKGYSKSYAEKKSKGEFRRQDLSKQTSRPNLYLTGDMMNDFKVTKKNKQLVQLGWLTEAEKVTGNATRGRRIYGTDSQPFPPKIMSHIGEEVTTYAFKQADKYMKSKVEIKMDI